MMDVKQTITEVFTPPKQGGVPELIIALADFQIAHQDHQVVVNYTGCEDGLFILIEAHRLETQEEMDKRLQDQRDIQALIKANNEEKDRAEYARLRKKYE